MSSWPRRRVVVLVACGVAIAGALAGAIVIPGGSPTPRPTSGTTSTTSATTTSATTAPPPREQLGVSVNRLFNDRTFTSGQIDAQLGALAAAGATVARTDALWELAEPQAPVAGVHHYDWSFDDLIAGSLARHRLTWLAIIDYCAPWAQTVPAVLHSAPSSPLGSGAFAAFAAAFAARYGRGGSFWTAHRELAAEPVETYEIWNEPDNPVFWKPAPDPVGYADLYLRARAAITTVDPAAAVIVGGLTVPGRFLPAMIAARPVLAGRIEGVAIHPYGRSPRAVLRNVGRARHVLDSLGMSAVPLYVTEVGWTTHPAHALDWAPPDVRGAYLASTLGALAHLDCGVAATIVYTWVTPERDPRNREDWFGIHSPSGGASPDTGAFARGLRDAEQPAPRVDLCAGGG